MKWIVTLPNQKEAAPLQTLPQENDYNFGLPEQETTGDTIKRNLLGFGASIARGAAKGLAGAGDFALNLNEKLRSSSGQPTLTAEQLKGLELTPKVAEVEKNLTQNLPEGYLKPQSATGEFIQNVGEAIPNYLLNNPSKSLLTMFGKSVVQATGGQFGKQIAKKLGAGTLGEIAGEIIGSTGFSALRPSNAKKYLTQLKNQDYTQVRNLLKGKSVDGSDLEHFIESQYSNLEKGLGSIKWRKEAKDHLENLFNKVSSGKIGLEDIWQAKVDFNKLARESNSREAAALYSKMSKYLTEKLTKDASSLKGFNQVFPRAENLTQFMNLLESKPETIEETLRSVLRGTTTGKIYNSLIEKPVGQTAKLLKNPIARKYYYEAYGNALADNKGAVLESIRNLVNYTKREESNENKKGLQWIVESPK